MFNHFLITRFNLQKLDWYHDIESNEVLGENWLDERINLFIKFCLPSVLGQTDKNFKWLIFFEDGTQENLKELLNEITKYSFIEPIFVSGYKNFQTKLPILLKEKSYPNKKWMLTTRLDNDDALHKNFIKEIHSHISNFENNLVLFFPYGLCLNINNKKNLAVQYYPLNQFLTLVEDNCSTFFKTVYYCEHNSWGDNFIIRSLSKQVMWLQITHNRNLANIFKGSLVFKKLLSGFEITTIRFPWYYNLHIGALRFKQLVIKSPSLWNLRYLL